MLSEGWGLLVATSGDFRMATDNDDPPWNDPAQMIRRKLTVQPELFLVAEIEAQAPLRAGDCGLAAPVALAAVGAHPRVVELEQILIAGAQVAPAHACLEFLDVRQHGIVGGFSDTAVIAGQRFVAEDGAYWEIAEALERQKTMTRAALPPDMHNRISSRRIIAAARAVGTTRHPSFSSAASSSVKAL